MSVSVAIDKEDESATEDRAEKTVRSGRQVLVVEDDPGILRQIAYSLEAYGYEVATAMTGLQALKQLIRSRPDLLITDIMMPEMDGHELVSSVRADPELADLPVIMLTARVQDEDMMQGYQNGTDLYLTKPFNPAELVTFVQRILG
jgi:two-component system, OmpR family, alkaline phosphatase synthesis response regulator PhoP